MFQVSKLVYMVRALWDLKLGFLASLGFTPHGKVFQNHLQVLPLSFHLSRPGARTFHCSLPHATELNFCGEQRQHPSCLAFSPFPPARYLAPASPLSPSLPSPRSRPHKIQFLSKPPSRQHFSSLSPSPPSLYSRCLAPSPPIAHPMRSSFPLGQVDSSTSHREK